MALTPACPCDATVFEAHTNPTCLVTSRVKGIFAVVCGQTVTDIADQTEIDGLITANHARFIYTTKKDNYIPDSEPEYAENDHRCGPGRIKTGSVRDFQIRGLGDDGDNNAFLEQVNNGQGAFYFLIMDDNKSIALDPDTTSVNVRDGGGTGNMEVIFDIQMREDQGILPARVDISGNATLAFSC